MKSWGWITLGLVGILFGVFLHAGFSADYSDPKTLPDYLQIAATFSIPFLYFLIVERTRASVDGANRVFETELCEVLSSIQQVFDSISLHAMNIGEPISVYKAGWTTVSAAGLRLVNLASLARGRNQEKLGLDIDGIRRFVDELRTHMTQMLSLLNQTHEMPDELYGRMLRAYSHILYNHYLKLLHIHGHKLRKSHERPIPPGIQVT